MEELNDSKGPKRKKKDINAAADNSQPSQPVKPKKPRATAAKSKPRCKSKAAAAKSKSGVSASRKSPMKVKVKKLHGKKEKKETHESKKPRKSKKNVDKSGKREKKPKGDKKRKPEASLADREVEEGVEAEIPATCPDVTRTRKPPVNAKGCIGGITISPGVTPSRRSAVDKEKDNTPKVQEKTQVAQAEPTSPPAPSANDSQETAWPLGFK